MKLSPAMVALLTIAVFAVVGLVGILVLTARGNEVPEWLKLSVGPLLTFLMGLAAPSPLLKKEGE